MSRLRDCFAALRQAGRKALIPYITAGDPAPALTVPLMNALVAAGADVIELGVPFSDPMADGPVIQAACDRALAHRVNLPQVFDMVREFRRRDARTPVVLMGYLNPVEVMGYAAFAQAAARAGVDGVLTVDLPPEEAGDLIKELRAHAIDPIFLLAPTSSEERIARICAAASGFVYYVSLKGVTGSAKLDVAAVADKLARIRARTDLPIGVGFGIQDAESAARVAAVADAVVVGSALVRRIGALAAQPDKIEAEIGTLLIAMRRAMDESGARRPAAGGR
ncbi:MAG: tryptophan synthase subunit alpha [Gammaproteobacteria bacterium]|nr:tryptophan synthase subunit alpha [Gammaproteobacteria bacterium]